MTRSYSKPHPDSVYNRVDFPHGFDPGQLVVSPAVMNRGITPEFYIEMSECEPLTNEDGETTERSPLEIEMVRLKIAGDTCNEAVLVVDDEIRSRFPTEYAAWKQDPEAIAIAARRATSLKTWEQMPPGLADDLARRHITTVEHLAHLPDSTIGAIPFGRQWRDKAMAYLAAANEDIRFSELWGENAALRASVDQMSAEMEKTQKLMRSLMGEMTSNGAKTAQ
jgi:hypothetical protein